ncbi:hypothetical protein [Roseateles sp. BYS87W]|uniref:Uncharacterized protein n=1 Tax=Pelomonas baiyunensis TaxID=3299026 RepID=A0ABW7GTU9_9BURK
MHAMLLVGHRVPGTQHRLTHPQQTSVTIRLEAAALDTAVSNPPPLAMSEMPPATTTAEASAIAGTPTVPPSSAAAPDQVPLEFLGGQTPRISAPDAPLPEEGGALRAYIEVEDDGTPSEVHLTPAPGTANLHGAFSTLTRDGLINARLARKETAGPGAYCLQVEFEPGAPAPQLRWLVGAASSAARCLTGPAAVVRDLGRAAPP